MLDNEIVRTILIILLVIVFLWLLFKFIFNWDKDEKITSTSSNKMASPSKPSTASVAKASTPAVKKATPAPAPRKPVATTTRRATTTSTPAVTPSTKKDDLTKVEGIGPKINELLNKDGIRTFGQLATTSQTKLKSILDAAGSRYQMHDPATWPQQAEIASRGAWDELEKLQDKLSAGRK